MRVTYRRAKMKNVQTVWHALACMCHRQIHPSLAPSTKLFEPQFSARQGVSGYCFRWDTESMTSHPATSPVESNIGKHRLEGQRCTLLPAKNGFRKSTPIAPSTSLIATFQLKQILKQTGRLASQTFSKSDYVCM